MLLDINFVDNVLIKSGELNSVKNQLTELYKIAILR